MNLQNTLVRATADGQANIVPEPETADEHELPKIAHGDLKSKAVRGGALTFVAQAIKVMLNIASTAVLARLLSPIDFGMVAMVTAVTSFAETFKDAGLSTATVQRDRITRDQVTALFWTNVSVSTVLMLVVCAGAPLLSRFYREPRLTWVTVAVAAEFLLAGLTVQHLALLRRNMQFRQLAIIDIASLATGASTGVLAAWLGFGYWALVAMNLMTAFTNVVAAWTMLAWRPGSPRLPRGMGPILSFGSHIVALRFIYSFITSVPNILIGRFLGTAAVGLYQKAYGLLMFAIDQIHAPVAAVALSPLSRVQSEPDRFKRYFLTGYEIVISCALPVVAVSGVFATELILLLLGSQWTAAIPVFRWLAIAAIFVVLLNPLGMVLLAIGRADRQVKIVACDAVSVIAGYLVGLRFGLVSAAMSFAIVRSLTYLPITYAVLRGTAVKPLSVVLAARVPLGAAMVAAIAGLWFRSFAAGWPTLLVAALGVPLMLGVYATIVLLLCGRWAFYRDIISELRPQPVVARSL